MAHTRSIIAVAIVAGFGSLTVSVPAQARGCGGYVNVAVWGCAPWDNNPPEKGVTPGYRPVAPSPVRGTAPTAPIATTSPAGGGRLISENGLGMRNNPSAGIVSDHGGALMNRNKFISDQGGGLRR